MDKKLLNIKEICEYLGIGETKARELVRGCNGMQISESQMHGLKEKLHKNKKKKQIEFYGC